MEVIPLDDRVRSTTVLNTAAPSDFTTVYNDDNYDDAPDAFHDADGLAEADLAADAAANEGMWTRRNKLLLSLIAGSALLCAIATGSGVAAHRARVANLNKCPVGMMPNVGATSSVNPPPVGSAKSSKSPTAKSSKSTSGPVPVRKLTGATVPATVVEEVTGGAYYPSVPKTVEDKRKNRMLAEHLGQRDASSTLSWKLKNTLGEMMPKLNFGSDEEEEVQRLNDERRLATRAPTKSSKSPSAKASKSPTAKSSKAVKERLTDSIVDGLKPSDNCKCVNSGLNSSSGSGGGSGAKSSKSPSTKSSKSPSTKSSKSPSTRSSKSPSTKSSKSPSTKSSKSPSTKSSKSPTAGLVGGSPLAPTTCTTPVAPLGPSNPSAPGGKSSKSPTSKTGKSTRVPASTKTPLGTTPIAPVNPPGNEVKPPAPPATKPPATPAETKSPTPCTVDCPGVPVVDPTPTPPTPGGGGGENPSVPKPPPTPTPGTGELTPPVPTPPTPGTPDGGPTPSTTTPNCDNDGDWESAAGESCDDVANGDANVLCVTASSVDGTSASEACPAACNTECLTNCDNDDGWSSEDGKTCDDVAEDPIGLCLNADKGPSEAAAACPASCNKECFVNCDNDPLWIGVQDDETCDDVAEKPKELCDRLNSELVAASEACPAACKKECFPPTVDIPVGFPTRFPKLDSYGPTPETTVGVTVTVGEEDKTPPTFSPSRVVGVNTPMPTNLGTSIGTSVGSSGGTITVSTETTGPPTLASRDEDEQGDDEESVR